MPEEKSNSKDIVSMQMMMYGGGVEDLLEVWCVV